MIELLLPPAVACAEQRWEERAGVARALREAGAVHAQERELVAGASQRRRGEFLLGRACAHRALAALGGPDLPIGKGAQGQPCWPPGFTGSITHCAGYCAAALARTRELSAIGIDAEPNEPISERLLGRIAGECERALVTELLGVAAPAPGAVRFDRLLFCVKEALYKAVFAREGVGLPFGASQVRFTVEDGWRGGFEASLVAAAGERSRSFSGRWCLQGGVLGAALALSG
jgi:4'-phosphopantetheinyl transferase EntD